MAVGRCVAGPHLDPIRDRPAFQEIVAKGERRRQEAERITPPDPLVLSPDTPVADHAGQAPPLPLALHGVGRMAADEGPAWGGVAESRAPGHPTAILLPMSNDRYWWPDPGRAAGDLA